MNLNELTNHAAWNNADELVILMKEWSVAYYNDGNSSASDAVYDASKKRLEILDPYHPYMAVVGAPTNVDGEERHKIPMGSLDNVNNEQEFRDWWAKVNPELVVVQYKYDGLSLGLEYEDGNLNKGLLRGDGIFGENKSENISGCYHSEQINNLGDFSGSVRGEGIVYRSDFTDENFPGESNPRNSAVGAIRKSNSPRAKWVRIACYDLVDGKEYDTEVEKLEYMESLGLPVCQYQTFDNPDDVIAFYNETENNRESIDFLVDGLVIKINDTSRQKALGSKNSRPKWARALKFATMKGNTILRKIIISLSHTGSLIPTGEYDPLIIEGRTFTHALLNNFDTIEKLGLNVGDEIEIEICGDIIPRLKRIIKKNSEGTYPRPTVCPVCDAATVIDGAITRCSNPDCSAKTKGKVKNWIGKTGIKYIGESRQQDLFEAGVVTNPVDLYTITRDQLGAVIGNGNAANAMAQIDKYRTLPLHTFMGALGIKFLGRSNAKKLIKAGIDTLEKFKTFDPEIEKSRIDGFGDNLKEIANGIEACKDTINGLIEAEVKVTEPTPVAENQSSDKEVETRSFCFTGVRLGEMKDEFEARGWVEKSGISGNLDYLVAKDPTSTSGKAQKARDKGVKIIGLDEFKAMLDD